MPSNSPQFYSRVTLTSTASVATTFGFIAREYQLRNLSTGLVAHCQMDGNVASTLSYQLPANGTLQIAHAPTDRVNMLGTSTAAGHIVAVLALG